MESKTEFKTPSLGYSAFVLAALAISTFVQFKILGASLNVTMFLNWLLMTLLATSLPYTLNILDGIRYRSCHYLLRHGPYEREVLPSNIPCPLLYRIRSNRYILGNTRYHGYRPSWYRYRSWNPGRYDCRRSNLRCMVRR